MASQKLDQVISLAKRRGFVFQAGEIYGGSRSAWDYGPLGVALKENIKKQWWNFMVQRRDDVVARSLFDHVASEVRFHLNVQSLLHDPLGDGHLNDRDEAGRDLFVAGDFVDNLVPERLEGV